MQCNPNQTEHTRHVSEIKGGDGKMYRGLNPTPKVLGVEMLFSLRLQLKIQ